MHAEVGRRARAGLCIVALVLMATALAGCGEMKKGFDKGFNDSFNKKTHDSCVTSAVGGGAPADIAERYCTCVVNQLAPLTPSQKMGLNQSSPELQNAMTSCKTQATQQPT
jgi:hypothetical protein